MSDPVTRLFYVGLGDETPQSDAYLEASRLAKVGEESDIARAQASDDDQAFYHEEGDL